MTVASPPVTGSPAAASRTDAVATRAGEAFVRAVVGHDFEALEALLAPDVRFRALTPRAVREAATASSARGWIEGWFGETDRNRLIESRVEMVADRLHVAYRIRLREDGAWLLVEQHVFAAVGDGRLTDVALVCSGFRTIAAPGDDAAQSADATPGDDAAQSADATPGDDAAQSADATPGDDAAQSADATPGDDAATGAPRLPHVDARLDATGRSCATLTPDIRAAVRQLEPGQVLEIVADDPTAGDDLRAWARLTGHELVDRAPGSGPGGVFYVRRGGGTSTPAHAPGPASSGAEREVESTRTSHAGARL